jgi:hypothetical protein
MDDSEYISNSLTSAHKGTVPYRHWFLKNVLSYNSVEEIINLPVPVPDVIHDGWRANYKEDRIFFDPEMCSRHEVCRDVVAAFKSKFVKSAIERCCGIDLSESHLRIEYTLDTDGFYLKPHKDLDVKLFSLMVYLSSDPELSDSGTDMYDADLNHVKSSPFGKNHGMIFIPGDNTWHGLERRKIQGVRRSIIVNFVTDDWRAREELS